ncbi:MAG TPA: MFS transporter [Actinophytocola sp.]|nr:MFS transporter [Actinophytocola sp.]
MTTLVTIAAFEHLGVSTAMPRLVADLDGAALYSWPFTAFLAASVMATVLSGRVSDRLGPVPALLAGPALFLAGLFTAGLAQGMPMLLAGRVLQGLGLGTQVVGIYVLVALVFPVRRRPAAFGLLAAAWVVPSLVGPPAAAWCRRRSRPPRGSRRSPGPHSTRSGGSGSPGSPRWCPACGCCCRGERSPTGAGCRPPCSPAGCSPGPSSRSRRTCRSRSPPCTGSRPRWPGSRSPSVPAAGRRPRTGRAATRTSRGRG